ncbi:Kinesin- motor protein [Microbotryomycetes sp. JL221]|nr:Kinesin- motor protein [Microbotryomycetes sp. JL221]
MAFRKPSSATTMSKRQHPPPAPSASFGASSATRQQQQQQQQSAASTTAATASDTATTSQAMRRPRVSYKPRDAEGNINVVVRCRARSHNEFNSNAQLTTTVKSLRGSTVTLVNPALAPPPGALSSTSTPISRTYDFGHRPQQQEGKEPLGNVFGPDADQVMIYNDVARPILDEVLRGYNCTIFAYGQTGTGKTYTMEGDLSLSRGVSISAGIIPRTLYSLFAKLAEDKSDFSVRCSFVELYNEELRDLNALDYNESGVSAASGSSAASITSDGSAKPAQGATTTTGPGTGLRIYDDKATGSGVIIQGLEETMITSAEEGLKVLKRGSERRQSASTNCNEHSSRSHSIFTITIHIKEPSKTGGEDLLKVGKLNLVDLAGSENIGRSGAVQGRAREAGMINTSLLTLGRVINKLVEKQSHIPYRRVKPPFKSESKLTRLLQDSLGGRTKTTIIATISPVNFDETASTLDYALRAKKIENRPEINQRMTKNVLLGQIATEIERLKQDLLCAREKNGIFISSASWAEMAADQDSRRTQLEETKRLLEVNDAQLASIRDQFEQAMRLLGAKEEELDKANHVLEQHRQEIQNTLDQLAQVQRNLEEETVLREAFETSRNAWQTTANEAISNVAGLRAKIARKADVEQTNLRTLATANTTLSSITSTLNSRLAEFYKAQHQLVFEARGVLDDLCTQQTASLTVHQTKLAQQFKTLEKGRDDVVAINHDSDKRAQVFLEIVDTVRTKLLEQVADKAKYFAMDQRTRANEILDGMTAHAETNTAAIKSIVEPLEQAQTRMTELLQQNALAIMKLQTADQTALEEDNARLRSMVEDLRKQLAEERSKNAEEDDQLLALLEAKIKDRQNKRSERLEIAANTIKDNAQTLVEINQSRLDTRRTALVQVVKTETEILTTLNEATDAMRSCRDQSQQTLADDLIAMSVKIEAYEGAAQSATQSQIDVVNAASSELETATQKYSDEAQQSSSTLVSGIEGLRNVANAGLTASSQRLESVVALERSHVEQARHHLEMMSTSSMTIQHSSAQALESLHNGFSTYLSASIRRDVATGETPRKRSWPGDRLLSIVDLDTEPRSTLVDKLLNVKNSNGALSNTLGEEVPIEYVNDESDESRNGDDDEDGSTMLEVDASDAIEGFGQPLNSPTSSQHDFETYSAPTPPNGEVDRSRTPSEVEFIASALPPAPVVAQVNAPISKQSLQGQPPTMFGEREINTMKKMSRSRPPVNGRS